MKRSRILLAAGALASVLLLPSAAQAYDAVAAANVNIRVGPGTQYGVIDTVPAGSALDVIGCIAGYEWCDVEWNGVRGWVIGSSIANPNDRDAYLPTFAVTVGVPVVYFSFDDYHDRWYRDRPWYHKRHWTGIWDRDHRRDARIDRRDDRRDAREEGRDDRREVREDRRDDRREVREDRRDERRLDQRIEERRQGLKERRDRDRREVREERRRDQRRGVTQRRVEQRQGQDRQRALSVDRPERPRMQRLERVERSQRMERRSGGGGQRMEELRRN